MASSCDFYGKTHQEALSGLPAVVRWSQIRLHHDFEQLITSTKIDQLVSIQPFADQAWTAQVFHVNHGDHGVTINARPVTETSSTLFLELSNQHPERPAIRLDRPGAPTRIEIGWHKGLTSFVAVEFDKQQEADLRKKNHTAQK